MIGGMDTCVENAAKVPSTKPRSARSRVPYRRRPAKIPIISRVQVDGRTYAAKVFDKIAGDVTADLGGRDQLSAVEAMLVEAFAGVWVMIDDFNTRALLGEKVDPYAYCQISSTLVRVASRLGLHRRARDVGPSLGDILRADHVQQQSEAAE
jgi:hypothetical protein